MGVDSESTLTAWGAKQPHNPNAPRESIVVASFVFKLMFTLLCQFAQMRQMVILNQTTFLIK